MPVVADLHVPSRHSRATSRDRGLVSLPGPPACGRRGGRDRRLHPSGLVRRARGKSSSPPRRALPSLAGSRREVERDCRRLPPRGALHARGRGELHLQAARARAQDSQPHLRALPRGGAALSARLARIGNLASDGRPILGLDSRDLLEIVLETDRAPSWYRRTSGRRGFAARLEVRLRLRRGVLRRPRRPHVRGRDRALLRIRR